MSINGVLEMFVESYLKGHVHTLQPGEIVAVTDTQTPLVTVQPSFEVVVEEDEDNPEAQDPITDVPVLFPMFGDYCLVSSLKPGTPVLLATLERSIATWKNEGGIVDPVLNHSFDMSDCIAIVGLTNLASPLGVALPTDGMSLRRNDGTASVEILGTEVSAKNASGSLTIKTNGDIELSNGGPGCVLGVSDVAIGGGNDFVALAQKTEAKFTALFTAISGAAVSPADGGAAFKAAIIAALGTNPDWAAQIASLKLKTE
jgi:hypothetical protein